MGYLLDTHTLIWAVMEPCQLTAFYHRDSFDRMLIWQAVQNEFRILSKDADVLKYASEGLKVVW